MSVHTFEIFPAFNIAESNFSILGTLSICWTLQVTAFLTKSAARMMSVYVCVLWIVKSAYLSNSRPISALLHLSYQHLCSVVPCWKLSAGCIFEDYTHLIYAKYMPNTLHKYDGGKTPLSRDSCVHIFYATSGSPPGTWQYFPRAGTAGCYGRD